MVSAKEALALDGVLLRSEEEELSFRTLEGIIDSGIYGNFNGGPFALVVKTSSKIAAALQRLYEDGGWSVDVFLDVASQYKIVLTPRAR